MRLIRLATCWFLLAGGSFGCQKSAEDESAQSEAAELAKYRSQVAQFAERLSKLHGELKDAEPAEKSCSEAEIQQLLGKPEGGALFTQWQALLRFKGGADPYAGKGEKWRFLTTPALRAIPPVSSLNGKQRAIDALWNVQKLEREYRLLGVLRSRETREPRIDGTKFHPGLLRGELYLTDLRAGRVLCATAIEATSSETISGKLEEARNDVLWRDFVVRIRQAIDAAEDRLSRRIHFEMG